ncbi:MAG: DUF4129 domain-containing protein [Gemmatimonadetes bacterium]|nr:DUF4129 domain-containing protein [Gemmatimonadota bacterium]MYE70115.1 DUF4129 domain-containing protein [Gemmatimonadota bacterium]MYJ67491.1 DUF4129 domain-containing protein [Gemmatimonadota bacterium]
MHPRLTGQEPPATGPAAQEGPTVLDQSPPPEAISEALREILAAPEFATFEPPARTSLIGELLGLVMRLVDWILSLFDASGLLKVLAVVLPLLVLVAAGVIVVRRRRDAVRRPAKAGDPSMEEVPVTASEWMKLASDRAGKGHLRSAATALYQGFLLTLDGMGALAFHPSKTPGDYTREMSRSYAAGTDARAGRRFINSFQGFSFGHESPTDDGYADLSRLAREAGCAAGDADGEADSDPRDESE